MGKNTIIKKLEAQKATSKMLVRAMEYIIMYPREGMNDSCRILSSCVDLIIEDAGEVIKEALLHVPCNLGIQ